MRPFIAFLQILIEKVPRLNVNKGDKYKRTPLAMAARDGNTRIVALLIQHRANPDLADTSLNSPLHYAAAYGWLETIELLQKYAAEPNSPENAWKSTPLTIAMQKNHLSITRHFLKCANVNVNAKDDDGRTILMLVLLNVNKDAPEFVKDLVEKR